MSDHTAEVLEEVAAERARQIELGWTSEHDDRHNVHHLVDLAGKRARRENRADPGYYSRTHLVQAATLLVAAIEHMDRGA